MQEQNQHSLQNGSKLNHYKIIRVLGVGGFGITYLAEDLQLGMKVVIKEYFPNEFAIRKHDSTIIAKTSSGEAFSKGLQRFKEEAKTLARFSHPSIVKILGYFEANQTGYFVMEYEEGIDLAQYLKQKGTRLSQEEILSIIMPILEGLKEVHAHNYLHRDIKPGNILLRDKRGPVLIDFGASKLALGEASKSITSMLTEGYAPLEQYSTNVKQQGPFTDLYAVGAVIYKMITGEVPPSAQTRSYDLLQDGHDPFKPLLSLKLSGYDHDFLQAVDRALEIKAKNRPQTVQDFQADIVGELIIESKKKKIVPEKSSNKSMAVMVTALVLIAFVAGYFYLNNKQLTVSTPKIVPYEVNHKTAKKQQETQIALAKQKKLELEQKKDDPKCKLAPMSLEGCVVRMADTVAYIGRDIEDAILLGLIQRSDIPLSCQEKIGQTNGEIVYTLVTDLIANSSTPSNKEEGKGYIGFSAELADQLKELKEFNYTNIYLHPKTKTNLPLIRNCYETLFDHYLQQLANGHATEHVDIMTDMDSSYLATHSPAAMVCDYIAGMTDDFFLKQAASVGCRIPEKQ